MSDITIPTPKEKLAKLKENFDTAVTQLLQECVTAINRSDGMTALIHLRSKGFSEPVIARAIEELTRKGWKAEVQKGSKGGAKLVISGGDE